jgi:hypothetical protein
MFNFFRNMIRDLFNRIVMSQGKYITHSTKNVSTIIYVDNIDCYKVKKVKSEA